MSRSGASTTDHETLAQLIERHRSLYDGPEIEAKLTRIIRDSPESKLSAWDIHRLLRASRAVYFDTHVEVVSGHHTATYLRFEAISRFPQLITLIGRDMADWLARTSAADPITGILTTASQAGLLAERVAHLLQDRVRLRVVLTPFDRETGRIGTEIAPGTIKAGERFVVLNDVTTRGQCVSKLGKVVADHGGVTAGMLVFARRDSGQFPLMDELTSTRPFYFTTDLDMPQWEPAACPLCKTNARLLHWKDVPEF